MGESGIWDLEFVIRLGGWGSVSRVHCAGVRVHDPLELIEGVLPVAREVESFDLLLQPAPLLLADEDGVALHACDQDRTQPGTDLIHHELKFILGIVARDPLNGHSLPPTLQLSHLCQPGSSWSWIHIARRISVLRSSSSIIPSGAANRSLDTVRV